MKNYYLIFIILFSFSNETYSQQYQLLPDSCTICMYYSGDGMLFSSYYSINPENDTLISGLNYLVVEDGSSSATVWNQPLYVRQEDNKLYGRQADSISDVLIMDFDAQIGDTIFNLYSENHLYHARVLSLDSIMLVDGSFHRFMWLMSTQILTNGIWTNIEWSFSWHERGVCNAQNYSGSEFDLGGIWHNIPRGFLNTFGLQYYSPSYCTTDSRYITMNGNQCQDCIPIHGQSGFSEFGSDSKSVQIYPNPMSDILNFHFEETGYLNIKIRSLSGMEIGNYTVIDNESINVSTLSAGIYIVECSTSVWKYNRIVIKE